MWLLDTTSLALTAFFDHNTPHYAILSHTWGPEEVSFQDIQGPHEAIANRAGYRKIKGFCSTASEAGFEWGWVDTCCIDKTNNAELSEAINSMYRWYSNAVTCYAYLADVTSFIFPRYTESRWFQRGWTLQELIAPSEVLFFDPSWSGIGSRASLAPEIEAKTRIPAALLMMESSLKDYCVAEIMSWAAGRQTTRAEDRAYSLLGLFGVYMPMLYGEGAYAFIRLQLEIVKSTTDHSIFASDLYNAVFLSPKDKRGLLTPSVDDFIKSGDVRSLPGLDETSFEMTNLGLRISLPCCLIGLDQNRCRTLLAFLNCKSKISRNNLERLCIKLAEESSEDGKPLGRFRRFGSIQLERVDQGEIQPTLLYIVQPTYSHHQRLPLSTRPLSCSLDFRDLIRAGYVVEESFGARENPLYKGNSKIIFELSGEMSRSRFGDTHKSTMPQHWMIMIFKHATKSTRFWILLGLQLGKLGCRIKNEYGVIDRPENFFDAINHPCFRRYESLAHFDHAIEKRLDGGDIVRLTVQRALILNRVGQMVKIALQE